MRNHLKSGQQESSVDEKTCDLECAQSSTGSANVLRAAVWKNCSDDVHKPVFSQMFDSFACPRGRLWARSYGVHVDGMLGLGFKRS